MPESRIPWKGDGTEHTFGDCRTPDGVTVSLIDGLIAVCRVLRERNLTAPAVLAALSDLWQDEDVLATVSPTRSVVVESARHLQAEAEQRLDRVRGLVEARLREPVYAHEKRTLEVLLAELEGPR
ncbi:hypothetical protein GCM10027258_62860 [Amycolatopsis stemonae]